jgi:hypothetical protein
MMTLRTAVLPAQKGKRSITGKAQARADAKAEDVAAAGKIQTAQASGSAACGTAKKSAPFVWDFAKEVEGKTFQKGEYIQSQKFSLLGVPDLQMSLYPQGQTTAKGGHMSLYLNAPEGWQVNYKASLGDVTKTLGMTTFSKEGQLAWGWADFATSTSSKTTKIAVELLEAIPPEANA